MRHTRMILLEFAKEARKWNDLTYDEQKGYLKRHPKSKRKLTARPESPSKKSEESKKDYKRKEKPDTSELRKRIEGKKEKGAEPGTKSDTPKLDEKLGNVFDIYSSMMQPPRKPHPFDDKANAAKLEKAWKKEFPDEKVDVFNIVYSVERNMGLVPKNRKTKEKPERRKPLTKEEFVQAAKDVYLKSEGRLPKVEGEDDPSGKETKTYGLTKPLTLSERVRLKAIEDSLPDDQKQFAKYLVHVHGEQDEHRSLEDASGERPIIKNEYDRDDGDHVIRYEVPTSNRRSAPKSGWSNYGAGGINYVSFDSVDNAKDYIKNAPRLEEKAKLIDEIGKIHSDINKSYKNACKDRWFSPTMANTIANSLAEQPREDQYGTRMDASGKEVGKWLYRKGQKFELTPEQHKNLARVLANLAVSPEQLENAVRDFDAFVRDVKTGIEKNILSSTVDADRFMKVKDKYKAALQQAIPKVKLADKLMDQYGYEKSKDDLKLPEGFKFKDKPTIGQRWNDEQIVVGNDDDTMEIVLSLGKPGDYGGKYSGEVYYTVPGQQGRYTIGHRGFDSGLEVDWNDERSFDDIVKEIAEQVKQKQEKIARSVDVPVASGTWKVTPEGIEKIKQELQAGKTHTFAPHGMGTGYYVSKNPSRYSQRADSKTEQALGVSPLYIQSYDHD